ncbi:MAG: hypothetical protein ACTSPY_17165 [Candidatus Helarchaeota archaeon]
MKSNRLLNLIIIYLLIWGISVFIPDLIFGDAASPNALMFTVIVPIQEQNTFYQLNLHYSTFFEFLLPIILIPIITWIIHKEIIRENDEDSQTFKNDSNIKSLFLGGLLIMMTGFGIHYVGDAIDTQLQWHPEDIDGTITTFPKLIAYFFDEVLGHKVLYTGIILILLSLFLFQYHHPLSDKNKINNNFILIGYFVFGLVYGIAQTFSFMEGQSAFEFMFICIILFITSLSILIKIKGNFLEKIRKYPFFVFFIIFNGAVFVTLIFFIPQMSSVYPYFPQ